MHTIAIPIANSVSGDIFFFMLGSLLSLSDNSLLQTGAKVNRQIAQIREKKFLNFCSKKLLTNQGRVWYNIAARRAGKRAAHYITFRGACQQAKCTKIPGCIFMHPGWIFIQRPVTLSKSARFCAGRRSAAYCPVPRPTWGNPCTCIRYRPGGRSW